MKKTASAIWQGGLKDGKGLLSTESGALKHVTLEICKRSDQEAS